MIFCQEGGCPDIAVTGYFCPLHSDPLKRKTRNAIRNPVDRWYGLAVWCGKYGVRLMQLRRFPYCQVDGCKKKATQVHHLDKSWKDGDGDWNKFLGGIDLEGLQSICASCHARISMEELMFGPKKEVKQCQTAE